MLDTFYFAFLLPAVVFASSRTLSKLNNQDKDASFATTCKPNQYWQQEAQWHDTTLGTEVDLSGASTERGNWEPGRLVFGMRVCCGPSVLGESRMQLAPHNRLGYSARENMEYQEPGHLVSMRGHMMHF
jgi:hypothetical protein